ETDVTWKPRKRVEMMERANGSHSVPQIFIDGEHIGGCDDLYALDAGGELDAKLGLS
ncbi:MAG: glutaredoxin domain-containing protein, partial [Alphaproteobacteria bacterium]|nr:glutaredoxin domain-containing protein [Alphaproteobacteria bacterium]